MVSPPALKFPVKEIRFVYLFIVLYSSWRKEEGRNVKVAFILQLQWKCRLWVVGLGWAKGGGN